MNLENKNYKDLVHELNACQQRLQELEKSEAEIGRVKEALLDANFLLMSVLESPENVVILSLDKHYKYTAFNGGHKKTMKRIWGKDIEIGLNMLDVIKDENDRKKAKSNFDRVLNGERFTLIEEYGEKPNRFFYENIYNPIFDDEGNVLGLTVFLTDITRRVRAEEKQKALLKEKEVLLKEVHHRVKNNFMIISSLLNLQLPNIEDNKARTICRESRDRVQSMALIHERLYQAQDLASINFAGYIKILAKDLYMTYATDPENISLELEIKDVPMGVDTAIPCGLILNELLTNALKYAFPSQWHGKGQIKIKLQQLAENKIELTVKDNGVGLPKDFDIKKTHSLGLNLVSMLAEGQLDGHLFMENGQGATFRIVINNEG